MANWLSISTASKYAGVCPRTLKNWLKKGLRSSKVGSVVRIKDQWVDSFLEQHEQVDQDVIKVRRRLEAMDG